MTENTIPLKFFSLPLKYASTGDFKVYMLAGGKVLNILYPPRTTSCKYFQSHGCQTKGILLY
jgi:hypothetical protein